MDRGGAPEVVRSFARAWKRSLAHLRLVRGGGIDLGGLCAELADAYGDRPAIEASGRTPGLPERPVRTFVDLEHDVARLAAAHAQLGRPNERVVVATANRVDVLLHVLALVRAGAVPVPVNARLQRGELAEIVGASGATAIVADAELAHRIAPEGMAPGGARWRFSGEGTPPPGARGDDLAAWLAAHPGERRAASPRAADETALLLATSGTTGHPKLAALTSAGLLGGVALLSAAPVGRAHGLRAGRDAVIAALPLAHVMGLSVMLGALCAGVRAIHLERFSAPEVLDRIEAARPNVFVGVPTMYADLEAAGAADRDLSSIQLWVSAADVMPAERARRFQRWGAAARIAGRRVGIAAFADVYGMVELSGAAAVRVYAPSIAARLAPPAFAVTLPGFEVRAVDPEGRPLRHGQVGTLEVRGPGVLSRYEGARGAPLRDGGWFSTGDLARVWPGGVMSFAGRGRDRLKVGGFSVFPAEVEEALARHPDVAEVAVVGVPDERSGERLVALVVARRPGLDPAAFLGWAAGEVAGYRRPREALLVDALPRGPHGKIDRAAATRLASLRLAERRPSA